MRTARRWRIAERSSGVLVQELGVIVGEEPLPHTNDGDVHVAHEREIAIVDEAVAADEPIL